MNEIMGVLMFVYYNNRLKIGASYCMQGAAGKAVKALFMDVNATLPVCR